MIQKLKINFITLLFILISSCSDYRKILKTEGYEKKLKAAIEFYENDEFFKASTLFNDIKPLVKGSEESETVDFYFASSLYNLKQFDKSAKYFKSFIDNDHDDLLYILKNINNRFLLTYDNCIEIKKMYKWANIFEVSWRYHTANSNKASRKKGQELIITNY